MMEDIGQGSSSEDDQPSDGMPLCNPDHAASRDGIKTLDEINRDQPTHGYNLRSKDGLEQRLRRRANGVPSPLGSEKDSREDPSARFAADAGMGLGQKEALAAYRQGLLTPSHFSDHPRDAAHTFPLGAYRSAPVHMRGNPLEFTREDRGEMIRH